MDRSLFSLIGHGFWGFTALGVAALGFVWFSPGAPSGGAKPEDDWRLLEPITYENLTVFPVVSASGHDTRAFLTLEEGLSSGEIIVRGAGERRRLCATGTKIDPCHKAMVGRL